MAGLGDEPKLLYPAEDEVTLMDAILGRAEASIASRLSRPMEQVSTPSIKFVIP
jgi:hypothetical protein